MIKQEQNKNKKVYFYLDFHIKLLYNIHIWLRKTLWKEIYKKWVDLI